MTRAPLLGQSHVRSLDGARFVAFFAVFVFHALQHNAKIAPFTEYGSLGVQVFFVLSGFLIGGILLDLKEQAALPLRTRLRTFYIRRALRIFPLYYLFLLISVVLPALGVTAVDGREVFFWNATYLTNVKLYLDGALGGLSHLWSLSVEEHFYIVAPLLMLSFSIRQISIGVVSLWLACMAGRSIFDVHGQAYMLSPLQFDCMTLGVAAAILQATGSFLGIDYRRAMRFARTCGFLVLLLFAFRYAHSATVRLIGVALEHWVFATAVAGLVLSLWNSNGRGLASLLALPPLPYLGRISYGLYVFHLPCQILAYAWFSPSLKHGTAIPALGMTIVVSMASWHLFERPLNDLKRRFPYHPGAASTHAEAGDSSNGIAADVGSSSHTTTEKAESS